MPGGRCRGGIRCGSWLDGEVAEGRERGGFLERRERFVVANVPRFDERGADVESIGLVEHRLNQPFHCILGSAERAQSGHTQRAGRATEDQVSAPASAFAVGVGPFPEVGEGELDDVECAPEGRLELVPDLIVVLIFTGANDAVARAISYDVHSSPMFQTLFEDGVDG